MIGIFKRHTGILIIFVVTLLIGLNIYKDYGVAWDDTTQREIGQVSYNYVFNNDDSLFKYRDKDYGVGFELPLIIVEKQLGLTDTRDVFLMRHLLTHLFFLFSMLVGYMLIYKLFKNKFIACVGFLMLVFHPRIYAHSFFNTKDVPFLAMFLLSLAAVYIAFKKDRAKWYLLAGIAAGYTCGTRIMGVILLGFVSLFVLIDIVQALRQKQKVVKQVRNYLLFVAAFILALYVSWPYLWSDPINHFIASYRAFSHYRWHGEVLFRGSLITSTSLPWTYLPIWIGITTPVLWMLFAITGIVLFITRFYKKPLSFLSNTPDRNFLIYFLSFLVPVLAVIVLHSVVYDDWRHLYFIYPPLVMLMAYALDHLMKRYKRNFFRELFAIQAIFIAVFMIKGHPFQQVFFNQLVSHNEGNLKKQFEMDYWGCSYKDGLEWLAKYEKSDSIRVLSIKPLSNNLLLLPAETRKRFIEVSETEVPYYLPTNYRFAYKDSFNHPLLHSIKSGNSPVMDIYRVEK